MGLKKSHLEKARQVKQIIDTQYYEHYTYQYLSRMVGTNVRNLAEAFKAITGKPIDEYRTSKRIEMAKFFLLTTELTVEEIAEKVGIDKSNLYKQFKIIVGTTPYAWRLDQQNNDHQDYEKSGESFSKNELI